MTNSGADTAARRQAGTIKLHGPEAFAAMRKAGQLTAQALDALVDFVKPGVTTDAIDRVVFDFAMAHGAYPATLYYHGYPRSCCTSINEVICHGIPSDRQLKDGDIVNIDVTLIVDGWHGDASRMYSVGKLKPFAARLVKVTHECLELGIAAVRPGATTRDIGKAIQKHAESERFSVVRDFCGHGLGQLFHDEPNILHYDPLKEIDTVTDPRRRAQLEQELVFLKPGMIFTIEPMINLGRSQVKISRKDGWTAVTADKSLSAQFEHTIGVTETGVEIFTRSPRGLDFPDQPGEALPTLL
jgi:methionyl aminopeptidase